MHLRVFLLWIPSYLSSSALEPPHPPGMFITAGSFQFSAICCLHIPVVFQCHWFLFFQTLNKSYHECFEVFLVLIFGLASLVFYCFVLFLGRISFCSPYRPETYDWLLAPCFSLTNHGIIDVCQHSWLLSGFWVLFWLVVVLSPLYQQRFSPKCCSLLES